MSSRASRGPAGRIVGALVAGYAQAGRDLQDLVPVMNAVDYKQFEDKTAVDHLGPVGEAAEVLSASVSTKAISS